MAATPQRVALPSLAQRVRQRFRLAYLTLRIAPRMRRVIRNVEEDALCVGQPRRRTIGLLVALSACQSELNSPTRRESHSAYARKKTQRRNSPVGQVRRTYTMSALQQREALLLLGYCLARDERDISQTTVTMLTPALAEIFGRSGVPDKHMERMIYEMFKKRLRRMREQITSADLNRRALRAIREVEEMCRREDFVH